MFYMRAISDNNSTVFPTHAREVVCTSLLITIVFLTHLVFLYESWQNWPIIALVFMIYALKASILDTTDWP